MSTDNPSLPHLSTTFTPAQHAAHTSPRGVQYPIGMSTTKAASLLSKVARSAGKNTLKAVGTGRQGKGKSKNRVSKSVAQTITGVKQK